jgi:citrate synthase
MYMAENTPTIYQGLDGVYITESKICKVDGTLGRLYYRGYSIDVLAQNSSFEEVSYLLLYGKLPNKMELESFENELNSERDIPDGVKNIIREMAKKADPMETLRTAVSALVISDAEVKDNSPAANLRKMVKLISKISTIVAQIGRLRAGKDFIPPAKNIGHVENFLYMLNGKAADAKLVKFINTMFILQAEHSSNASTFATLVTGSTLADIYSAVTSGISALKGPLHGGADEEALRMMLAIGNPDNTETYINEALAGKQKIMGFGHRVYKAYDPRAKVLKTWLVDIDKTSNGKVKDLIQIALRAEKLMVERLGQSHGIWPNVDFFTGPLYTWAGIPIELFTPLFAAARISGWCAHMLEYWEHNKLFRPLEYYTGPINLDYVPLDKR